MLLNLTIVIPVRNEEINLPGCLAAIGKNFVKKIIIVDSGSNDKTRDNFQKNEIGIFKIISLIQNGYYFWMLMSI